jgi:hypothetical protein
MDAYTEQLYDKGEDLLQQGWRPRGVALLERALERHPDDHQLLLRVASVYEKNGALSEAARSYRRLGQIFDGMGHPHKAWTLRDRADRIDEMFGTLLEVDVEEAPAATLIWAPRPPAARSIGFLSFCLGVLVALFPLSVPEVSDELSERVQAFAPSASEHVSILHG